MPMRHVSLRQLQIFEAAARSLSFSRAAQELHVTQPGISMQIKELEASAGLPLFERIGKKLYVTEAGRELLRHVHDIQRSLKDVDETFDSLKGLRGGRISVAVVSTARYFAPQMLARFRKLHPAVQIELHVNNREVVVEQLIGNAVDLSIMGSPPQSVETVANPFARHPLVIIAATDHPLARRRRIPLASLVGETFIVRESGSGTRSAMEHFFAEQNVDVRVDMEMASNETIKQAVMAGMGLSFISRHTVGLELESKRLVVLDVKGLPVMRQWNVVHLRAKRLSLMADAFKSFVVSHGRRILRAHAGAE
jgi:LysR family transcriptional regulator, low CO2-responsive transcriptional regulator